MEWQILSFDWNHARALLVTAETGSYSAAAKALGTTQPTIGRQIAALEEQLAVTLIERIGRGVALTDAGLALVEHAREMAESARHFALVASGRSEALEGTVTITASESICVYVLAPVIATLREQYPDIALDVVATGRVTNLREREADVAIRNFRPDDTELVATKLPDERGSFYAVPEYLDKIGRPHAIDDLGHVNFIGFNRTPDYVRAMAGLGLTMTEAQIVLASDNHVFQWEMTCRGLGVGMNMERIGDTEPRVERAFPDLAPIPIPMWLTSHREVRTSRRVRVVFDAILDFFRSSG